MNFSQPCLLLSLLLILRILRVKIPGSPASLMPPIGIQEVFVGAKMQFLTPLVADDDLVQEHPL